MCVGGVFYFMAVLNSLLPILIAGVVFVNGFTDAPNAIATVIGTGTMKNRNAVVMCAVFNFIGVFVMSMFSSGVAGTITGMIDFSSNQLYAAASISAAMFSIVVWAVLAWVFSIPTSESHALISGLIGAAVSVNGFDAGINIVELKRILIGLLLSMFGGFILGYILNKLINIIFYKTIEAKRTKGFEMAQIGGAAAMSFLHGAQDGQKFVAVYVICSQITKGIYRGGTVDIRGHIGILIACAVIMGLGTSFGGGRIIQSVGFDMVHMEVSEGFSADLASSISLFLLSITGFPVSTTQVKTTAVMGVGASKGREHLNWDIAKQMVLAWGLTFPGCFILSFLVTRVFLSLFT